MSEKKQFSKKQKVIIAVLVGIIGIIIIANTDSKDVERKRGVDTRCQPEIVKWSFSNKRVGSGDFTASVGFSQTFRVKVKNPCKKAIKDIEFKIVFKAESGTELSSREKTILKVIQPKKSRWFSFDVSPGSEYKQVKSANLSIQDFKN